MKKFYVLLCLLISGGALWGQEIDYSSQSISDLLKENANAVVRLDRMEITIKGLKEVNFRYKRVVTVLNKRGREAVNAYRYYDDEYHINNIRAVVYNGVGQEIKTFKERDFKDRSMVPSGTLYSDSRIKYIDYNPVSYPYTVVFTYEAETNNTLPIPGFYFVRGYDVAVEKSQYILHDDSETFKVRIREKNLREYSIQKKETPTTLIYTGINILPIKKEVLGPHFQTIAPQLLVSPVQFFISGHQGKITDWQSFGKWMYEDLLKNRGQLPTETITKMKALTANCSTDLEKAKIIYEYVQNSTRYISVQIGIGGNQPAPAAEVDKLKYGDCKGLTNYTKALLKSVGVPSYYTVVEAGISKVDFDSDFASLKQGNHIILAIPYNNKLYWVDCTSSTNPFGYLGSFTDDRRVMLVKPSGGKIVMTPGFNSQENVQKITAEIVLNQTGSISVTADIETTGVRYDFHEDLKLLKEKKLKKYYRNQWDYLDGFTLTNYSFSQDKNIPKFKETLQFTAHNVVAKAGAYLLLDLNLLNKNTYVPQRYADRNQPFHIERGYVDVDSLHITIPSGYIITDLPEPKEIKSEFGRYRAELKRMKPRQLLFVKKLWIKSGEYPKGKYEAYRNFRVKIVRAENSKISLKKIKS